MSGGMREGGGLAGFGAGKVPQLSSIEPQEPARKPQKPGANPQRTAKLSKRVLNGRLGPDQVRGRQAMTNWGS
jgi:hypothetical protein